MSSFPRIHLNLIFLSILLSLLSSHDCFLAPNLDYDILVNNDDSPDIEVIEVHIEEPTTSSNQNYFHDVCDHPLSLSLN